MKNYCTFSEYIEDLTEMSIAGYGDWVPNKSMIGSKSSFVVQSKWNLVGDIRAKSGDSFKVYRSPTGSQYIAGDFKQTSTNETIFEIVFKIKLTEQKSIGLAFGYKKLMNVDGVEVHSDLQGDGIALAVYKLLVKEEHLNILGDEIQYFGARKLWSRLSKTTDVIVDIIDIETDKVLEKDVVLHHGEVDYDFDERIWDYADIKKNIRLVLTKVKD